MRVLKWNVDVDDVPHPIGQGKVVLVACQHSDASVQVWTQEEGAHPEERPRAAQVYATGQPIPEGLEHVGSALALNGRLIWHIYAVPVKP
jgi:hypothetical protein